MPRPGAQLLGQKAAKVVAARRFCVADSEAASKRRAADLRPQSVQSLSLPELGLAFLLGTLDDKGRQPRFVFKTDQTLVLAQVREFGVRIAAHP